jgi:hypothetical protein
MLNDLIYRTEKTDDLALPHFLATALWDSYHKTLTIPDKNGIVEDFHKNRDASKPIEDTYARGNDSQLLKMFG